MGNRIVFNLLGSFFTAVGGFLLAAAIWNHSAPLSPTYTILSLAIMAFCLGCLDPQFRQQDERMKLIRQKGMFFSFIAFLFYSFALTTALEFGLFELNASEAINILTALMISTVFTSWVFLARKY